jgi:hypothetical protein
MKPVYLMLIAASIILFECFVPVAGDIQCRMDIQPKYVDHGQTFVVTVHYHNPYSEPLDHTTADYSFDSRIEIVDSICSYFPPIPWLDCDDMFLGSWIGDAPSFTGKISDSTPTGTLLPIHFEMANYCDPFGDCKNPQGCLANGEVYVTDKTAPVPEFPNAIFPVVLVTGIFGAVLYIRRTTKP